MRRNLAQSLLLGVCALSLLLSGCGGGTRETTARTTPPGVISEKTAKGGMPTTPKLGLPVDEDTFWQFGHALYEIVSEKAHAAGLEYGQPSYFEYRLPKTWDETSEDLAERYLAHCLRASVDAGFDFSSLTGQDIAGCVWIFASDGKSRVYIGLCDPDGAICGLWEDDFRPAEGAADWEHWSVLDLELTEWDTFVSN